MASSSAKAVKFVASDSSGLPLKRKQVQHACEPCRRKKKRCIHTENLSLEAPTGEAGRRGSAHRSSMSSVPPLLTAENGSNPSPPGDTYGVPSPTSLRSSRFVGDLNPEGMFVEATGPDSASDPAGKDELGVWLPPANLASSEAASIVVSRPPVLMDRVLLPFVRDHCLTCVPPERDFRRLYKVYVDKIHPIFALVPESVLEDSDSPAATVMRQVISLAAATDPTMSSYLRLSNQGPRRLPFTEFSQLLSGAVRAILDTGLISDRTVHIRALCMLSLYLQPSNPDEADVPAELGGRAIHHAQTLGLHLLRLTTEAHETLFCAVWAIDRINAAAYGRPCLLHERDIGESLDECIRRQPPCFRLFLTIVQWLDKVIELYRPGTTVERKQFIDVPVLEPLVLEANGLTIPNHLLVTIEVFYHAVIILSCRLPRPGTENSYLSTVPPPSASARRSLAAERIAVAVQREELSPMPFVPYGVSLALSVEYRKMRHSLLPIFRARAREAFKVNCEVLRKFGEMFWSARVVAGLGERVLREMERAATSLAHEAHPSIPLGSTEVSTFSRDTNGSGSRVVVPQALPGAMVNDLSALESIDFSVVDAIPHLDVFGHFDPSFNLPAVDNVLEANLDIGLPLNWGDWEQFVT